QWKRRARRYRRRAVSSRFARASSCSRVRSGIEPICRKYRPRASSGPLEPYSKSEPVDSSSSAAGASSRYFADPGSASALVKEFSAISGADTAWRDIDFIFIQSKDSQSLYVVRRPKGLGDRVRQRKPLRAGKIRAFGEFRPSPVVKATAACTGIIGKIPPA